MTWFAEHRRVATVALVVANYDEAIAWYVERLGFLLTEDVDFGGKRRVTVAPAEGQAPGCCWPGCRRGSEQKHRQPGGGRAFCSSRPLPATMRRCGQGRRIPRGAALRHGRWWFFADLHGNLWDLIEPKR